MGLNVSSHYTTEIPIFKRLCKKFGFIYNYWTDFSVGNS